MRYNSDPKRSSWSSILKFLYVWCLLAVVSWSPIYGSVYEEGFVVKAYGEERPKEAPPGDVPLLAVGDRYEHALESRWYRTNVTFEATEEREWGFLMRATYRQEPKPRPLAEGIEIIRPHPAAMQEDRFAVDHQGRPLEATYTSGYWESTWGAQNSVIDDSKEFVRGKR